jgi:hypothetical protein
VIRVDIPELLAEDYLRKSESFGMQICNKSCKYSRECERKSIESALKWVNGSTSPTILGKLGEMGKDEGYQEIGRTGYQEVIK